MRLFPSKFIQSLTSWLAALLCLTMATTPVLAAQTAADYAAGAQTFEFPAKFQTMAGQSSVASPSANLESREPGFLRPRPPVELSPMEKFFATSPGVVSPLRQFGYQMFTGAMAENVASGDASVPDDYPLGPGDSLILDVPLSTRPIRTVVDRAGTVFVPNFGTLSVAGQTLANFQATLRAKAHGTAITVRLDRLRSLTVYLAGQVARPGSYTVSALSTISSLLQQAGGVLKSGSLRRIQLHRGNHTVRSFDFYDFLLKGQNAGNVRLQSGDIVFVPPIGPEVGVSGDVLRPAIYELRGEQDLGDVLKLAGGLLSIAYSARVHLQRIAPDSGRTVRDLDLHNPESLSLKVRDGDLLEVGQVLNRFANGVELTGNVERPGVYQIAPGTRVSDVVGTLGQLKEQTYFDYAQIQREVGPDRHIEIVPFDLGKALAGDKAADIVLQPDDRIVIYSDLDFGVAPSVAIQGAVVRPGTYPLYKNLHLSALINEAGGLLPQADGAHGELARTVIAKGKAHVERLLFSPLGALSGDSTQDPILSKDDVIIIKTTYNYTLPQTVYIGGEIGQPGTYDFKQGDTLSNLIERAGGYLPEAYLAGAVFTRETVRKAQQQQLAILGNQLNRSVMAVAASQSADASGAAYMGAEKNLLGEIAKTQALGRVVVHLENPQEMRLDHSDLTLEPGDRLIIPPRTNVVSVFGDVYSPSAYVYRPGFTVEDYLRLAGGATQAGDLNHVYVIRADGRVDSNDNYHAGWFIFSHGLLQAHLRPGDSIAVPDRLFKAPVDPLLVASQFASVLSNTLTSAAAIYGIAGLLHK